MKLSICIATFKRAAFIAETLESIVAQLMPGMEIVIVDGASPDGTEAAVAPFVARYPEVRYVREPVNSGVDADYDKAVGYARGDYVWLMSDDDLFLAGAVAKVLAALDGKPDLVVVDSVVKDAALAQVVEPRRFGFTGTRHYDVTTGDRLFADVGGPMSFIGGTIFRRAFWMARDRERFYGSLFIHVGMAFQQPAPARAVAIGESLIAIRYGNAMWSARSFEIWMFLWPQLIWGLPGYSDSARAAVTPREPWRNWRQIAIYRASGAYTVHEFRRFFGGVPATTRLRLLALALVPGRLLNILVVGYLAKRLAAYGPDLYTLVHASRFAGPISRALARRLVRADS
jgi:abequosyltransferase